VKYTREQLFKGAVERDNVRESIFQAAIEFFARKGFFATTIRDIVNKADVTQPMVYYYFGSKEQLFTSVVKEMFTQIVDTYSEINEDLPFEEYLAQIAAVGEKIFRDNQEAVLLMTNYFYSPDMYPHSPEAKKLVWAPIKMLADAAISAKKKGLIRKDVDELAVAMFFFGAIGFIKTINYIDENVEKIPHNIEIEYTNKQLIKLLLKGITK